MAKKKNRYEKKAQKNYFLNGLHGNVATKNDLKSTALMTGKDLLVGVLGGGLIGAAIGKPSLLVGIITTGAGHYTGNRLVQLLGIGLMASNGFSKSTSVSGLEGLEGVKDRLLAYKVSFSEKLYLDKILKKAGTTNGFGEVQYFNYPEMNGDLAALNAIEDQIAESGMQFSGNMGGATDYDFGDVDDPMY